MTPEQATAALLADLASRHVIHDGIPVPPGIVDQGEKAIWAYVSTQMYYKKLRGDPAPPTLEGVIADE
jgi:hypothetical protein